VSAPAGADLSSLLKRFRTQAGLSQQMLADRALISVQAVSALERGSRKVPYQHTLERIADALSLTAEGRAELELSAKRARGMRLEVPVTAPPQNLPRQLTAFFGRGEVVKEVVALLAQTPLVSIVGTGGAGKTRLAVAVGTTLLNSFADGVWFVDLSPLTDPDLVPQTLASVLHVQESPKRPLLETLVAYIGRKRALIVLDNCEHVMSGARMVAGSLLRECPDVALLATSREALAVTGERAYRIPPLAVPRRGIPAPEDALRYGAIELFVDRMRAIDSRAAVTSDNVEPIVEICRRLDGLPLALELAAARTAVLSPRQICERLDGVFDILTDNGAAAIPRHQTMRAAIDWSYGLLSTQARLLFTRLAIFGGGFSLESAIAVCCDERLAADGLLDLMSLLVAQSLVAVDFEHGNSRYHLLEATRQYALEELEQHGRRTAIARQHALAFLGLAERFDRDWYDAPERSWFQEAEAEVDNFRMALHWSLSERHDLASGRVLAAALARVWYSIAPVEGRRWVRVAIDCSNDETPNVLAPLYIADAELCGSLGEYKASLFAAQQALQLDGGLDELQQARAKQAAGSALGALGRAAEGQVLLEEALDLSRRLANRRMQALVLGDLGTARSRCGDVDGARKFYADALGYYEALNLERPAASIAGNLAEVEFGAGNAAAALQLAEQARAAHEATQNRRSVANDLCNMAAYLIALNCFDDGRSYGRQALVAVRDVKQTVLMAYVLQHLAAVAALQPRSENRGVDAARKRSAMLLGFVDAWLTKLEAPREYTERQEYDRVVAALRTVLGDRLESTMAHGAQWTEAAAVTVALEL
jgi:predicted ATPase/transcriptional regulator with XRE-family HTH domain